MVSSIGRPALIIVSNFLVKTITSTVGTFLGARFPAFTSFSFLGLTSFPEILIKEVIIILSSFSLKAASSLLSAVI